MCRHIENGGVCKEPAETEILAQIHVSLESRKAGAGKTPASVYEVGRYTRRIKPQPRAAVAKTSCKHHEYSEREYCPNCGAKMKGEEE